MRRRFAAARSLFLLAAAWAAPLAAQGTPAPRASSRATRSDSAYAAAAAAAAADRDSARAVFDTLRRRSYFFRDSMQPMMAQAFATRRVRIGVVVNTRPSDSDSIGALLDAVTPGGPAATAGLQAGDIITTFGGTPLAVKVSTVPPGTRMPNPGFRLVELVAKLQPNDTVAVEYPGAARLAEVGRRVVTAAEADNMTASSSAEAATAGLPSRTAGPTGSVAMVKTSGRSRWPCGGARSPAGRPGAWAPSSRG